MDEDKAIAISFFLIGLLCGVFILGIILIATTPVILSQETADTICQTITNNTASVGTSEQGNLVCSTPSYDHTQNIIVRSNNDKGGAS